LSDQGRIAREDDVGAERPQPLNELARVLVLVAKARHRRVLRELAPEGEPFGGERLWVVGMRLDPSLAGQEGGVVEVEDSVASPGQLPTQEGLEGVAGVVVDGKTDPAAHV